MSEYRPPYRYHYAAEKLYAGLGSLVGSGDVRDRLNSAGLNILHLQSSDFPTDVQEEWANIRHALTWLPVDYEGEGTLRATTRAMTEEEASSLADRILNLFFHVTVLENM